MTDFYRGKVTLEVIVGFSIEDDDDYQNSLENAIKDALKNYRYKIGIDDCTKISE